MIDKGKHFLLGINVSAVDYEKAVNLIVKAAVDGRALAVSALAVHGVMTGYLDPVHRRRLNGIDLVLPDGQPVRWGLRLLYKISLPDRVYGPELTLRVLEVAGEKKLPVYIYGSTEKTSKLFALNMKKRFPGLIIAGREPSKFRRLGLDERNDLVNRIKQSGARIVLVGLGCPRQEVWVYEYRNLLHIPLLAVGAAFDFHAGLLCQAPVWMQRKGLEWLFRLRHEPTRLWKRYLMLNPYYTVILLMQFLGLKNIPVVMPDGQEHIESYG